MTSNVTIRANGVSLICILIAIILFVVAALGVGDKLGFNLVDLGLAFFAGSFIF